jgi:hypothetical protein
MQYVIMWSIDIEADSVREAAEQALVIQRDPMSIATTFVVREADSTQEWFVDLEDEA